MDIDKILQDAQRELDIVTHANEIAGELGIDVPLTPGQYLWFFENEADIQDDQAVLYPQETNRHEYAVCLRDYATLLRNAGIVPEPIMESLEFPIGGGQKKMGYWKDKFDIPVKLECGCQTLWHEGDTLFPGVYAWCNEHGDTKVVDVYEDIISITLSDQNPIRRHPFMTKDAWTPGDKMCFAVRDGGYVYYVEGITHTGVEYRSREEGPFDSLDDAIFMALWFLKGSPQFCARLYHKLIEKGMVPGDNRIVSDLVYGFQ